MQVDDKFFAEFYRKHVAGGGGRGMGYLEKHVADGAELVAVLRDLQSEYRLFVVGRGRDRSLVLTEGLDEWAECLEQGPVGDILASSDFSPTASVLIVQQYDAKKHYKVIDDEFMLARPLYVILCRWCVICQDMLLLLYYYILYVCIYLVFFLLIWNTNTQLRTFLFFFWSNCESGPVLFFF